MKAPRSLAAIVLVVLIVGCSSGDGSSSAPSILPPGASPSGMGSPSAALSPPFAEPTTPTASLAGPATMHDPDLALTLPPDWHTLPVSTVRSQLEQASATLTGPRKTQMDQKLADIDAGSLRLFVVGPSGFDSWQATVVISVFDSGSATTRIDSIESMIEAFAPVNNMDRREVALSIGTAIRLSLTAGVPKDFDQTAIPAHGIAYAVHLDDGRILVIDASGPDASTTFADLIDTMVSTIRPR